MACGTIANIHLIAKHERGVITRQGAVAEQEVDALLHHHLAREGQTDARARGFGGEEGDEDFASHLGGNGAAVVADRE